jgi:hypothetical protein
MLGANADAHPAGSRASPARAGAAWLAAGSHRSVSPRMARSPPDAERDMPVTPKRTPARLISKSFSRNVPSSELHTGRTHVSAAPREPVSAVLPGRAARRAAAQGHWRR